MTLDTPEASVSSELGPQRIDHILDVVVTYFRSIRPMLLAERSGDMRIEYKPDGSPVTPLDQQIERELKDLLRGTDSAIGFLGEEYGLDGNQETYLVIDPIDSTNSFIHGWPGSTNMAALIHNGQPVCAAVYDYDQDRMYTATIHDGAKLNGEPLVMQARHDVPTIWIDCLDADRRGRMYEAAERAGFVPSTLRPPNGSRLVELATGTLDVQICVTPNAGVYDLVPGLFIAKMAGVMVRNLESESWDPSNLDVIASASDEYMQKAEALLLS